MSVNRGIKNIFYGLLNQLVVIGFGLILPRMFIMSYGSEVNGLLSSVNQVYAYVALLEAGIGTASLQALYKTLSVGDKALTNSVLAATNIFYRRTGAFYLLAVVVLSIGFPIVLKSDIPSYTISFVVLFNGLGGVINYFFQGKYRILLRAEGKNYLLSNLSTCVYVGTSLLKVLLIHLGLDIVVIQGAYFGVNVIQMMYIMMYIRRHYSWIDLYAKPNFEAISSRSSVLVHQISNLIFSNTDIIVLTIMVGLKEVSVYALYNSFFNMVKSILYSFLDGIQYKLGQSFHSNQKEFLTLQDRFEASYITITFAMYSVLYVMISPFLSLYLKGVNDAQYIDSLLPLLFTIIFLLQGARGPMQLVTNYAQHFKQTENQAILEMIINLSVTILAVTRFGIYGVLMGTIAALLYRANAIVIYTNRFILKRNPSVTYKRWGWNACFFLSIYMISTQIHLSVDSVPQLIIYGLFTSICILSYYFFGMLLFEKNTLLWLMNGIKEKCMLFLHKRGFN